MSWDRPGPEPRPRPFEFFPQSLLWEPPVANPREPRLFARFTTLDNAFTTATVDTGIGGVFGLFRYADPCDDWKAQLDLSALALARYSDYDTLVANDYRAGLPLTVRYGPWDFKLAYEHTSGHLGDEVVTQFGLRRLDYAKDELLFGVSRVLMNNRLRVYGQFGYAFRQFVEGASGKDRYDFGAEWFYRGPTGHRGTPFAAVNLDFAGEANYDLNLVVQAGWLWRNPTKRFAQLRLFAEYYTGRSVYGQLLPFHESFWSAGIALDY
jgi:hypothetical protein